MPDSLGKNISRIILAKRLNKSLFVGAGNEENRGIIQRTSGPQSPSHLNNFIIAKTTEPGKNNPGLSFFWFAPERTEQEYGGYFLLSG